MKVHLPAEVWEREQETNVLISPSNEVEAERERVCGMGDAPVRDKVRVEICGGHKEARPDISENDIRLVSARNVATNIVTAGLETVVIHRAEKTSRKRKTAGTDGEALKPKYFMKNSPIL